MKTIVVTKKGSFDNVIIKEAAEPDIAADEILVKIAAAGVNPVDWKAVLNGYFNPPHILGSDIAGTIAAVGSNVKKF